MVVANGTQSTQLVEDEGSIVISITEIESKSKIIFEPAHVNSKKIENDGIVRKGISVVL